MKVELVIAYPTVADHAQFIISNRSLAFVSTNMGLYPTDCGAIPQLWDSIPQLWDSVSQL